MRVTLHEPAEATNGKAFAGQANPGDELFFPHVDSCCALIIVGDKVAVGGHMAAQLPGSEKTDHEAAGRHVWTQVLANHQRLNTPGASCTVVTVGESNWYAEVVSTIWTAAQPSGVLPLQITSKFCPYGADVCVTMADVMVWPCQKNVAYRYPILDDFAERRDVGE